MFASNPGFSAPAFNLQIFRPAMDSAGYITVNGSTMIDHLDFNVGLVANWAWRPLRLQADSPAGQRIFSVEHLFTPQFQVAMGFWRHLQIGASVPVSVMAGGRAQCDTTGANCRGYEAGALADELKFQRAGFADLGLHIKGGILDSARHPVGLALMFSTYLPISSWAGTDASNHLLSEENVTLRPLLVLDREWGRTRRWRTSINVGALVRLGTQTFTDQGHRNVADTAFCYPAATIMATSGCGTGLSRSAGTQISYGLGVLWSVVPDLLDLMGEFYGYADVTGAADNHPIEGLGGVKLHVSTRSYFLLGAGGGIYGLSDSGRQTGGSAVRVFGGFLFEPGTRDRDSDGIPDNEDRCPDDPEDKDGFEDRDGCPDPDNDNDKILDRVDRCPNDPETQNGFQDEDGCPDNRPDDGSGDKDGDGIVDRLDRCPTDPEDKDGFEDADGCPEPDNDNDNIPDLADRCPNEPGVPENGGCPAEPPKKQLVTVTSTKVEILEKVYFETGKATIKPESYPVLDAVAEAMRGHAEIKLLEIQGHADERGDDRRNLKLTDARAKSIRTYLIGKGIAEERLQAKGYGETKPLCREHDEACWSKNRRVEFIILKKD
jgi:outer membrane protein OmpA-like peptidoglycan-associated protein